MTIRRVSPGAESAREYPAAGRTLVVDDSLHALFAVLTTVEAGAVTLISPRDGTRRNARISLLGTEATRVAGRRRQLEHVVLTAGQAVYDVWHDGTRLWKVEIPGAGLRAERIDPGRN